MAVSHPGTEITFTTTPNNKLLNMVDRGEHGYTNARLLSVFLATQPCTSSKHATEKMADLQKYDISCKVEHGNR